MASTVMVREQVYTIDSQLEYLTRVAVPSRVWTEVHLPDNEELAHRRLVAESRARLEGWLRGYGSSP